MCWFEIFLQKNHTCYIVCFSDNNEAPTVVATDVEPDMGDQPANGECISFLTLCEYGDIVFLFLKKSELHCHIFMSYHFHC